jgi:2,3-bisphosphoglycerate-dependent phosphoglycerate mutase
MVDEQPEFRTRLRTIVVFSLLFAIFAAVIVLAYLTTFSRPLTTVILVRHAEKNIEPNNPNPDLSPAGRARAEELVRVFRNAGVTAIYATQYGRTQQTVQPLSTALSLPVRKVDSGNTAELVRQITTDHRGGTVFVAGHNNTVPEIIAALGAERLPVIPETEYDNLFVVTIYTSGKAKVMRMKYGSAEAATGNQQMMVKP